MCFENPLETVRPGNKCQLRASRSTQTTGTVLGYRKKFDSLCTVCSHRRLSVVCTPWVSFLCRITEMMILGKFVLEGIMHLPNAPFFCGFLESSQRKLWMVTSHPTSFFLDRSKRDVIIENNTCNTRRRPAVWFSPKYQQDKSFIFSLLHFALRQVPLQRKVNDQIVLYLHSLWRDYESLCCRHGIHVTDRTHRNGTFFPGNSHHSQSRPKKACLITSAKDQKYFHGKLSSILWYRCSFIHPRGLPS